MWKKGPLPPNTWHWGGVVVHPGGSGFRFADFHGDHVLLTDGTRVEPHEVAFYNNALTYPIAIVEDEDCPDCKVN